MTTITLNICTCPDRVTAESLAQRLVERKLAACVNIVPDITSIYAWQGKIEKEPEVLLLIKTATEHVEVMRQTLAEIHPYEVPEIISLPISGGHQPYMEWVRACTISTP